MLTTALNGCPLGGAQPRTLGQWVGWSATFVACVGLPVTMVLANKSAPAVLGLSALLATVAALLEKNGLRRLATRYRDCVLSGTGVAILVLAAVSVLSLVWSIAPSLTRRGLIEAAPELLSGTMLATAWPLTARRSDISRLLPIGLVAAAFLIVLESRTGLPLHKVVGTRALPFDLKRSAIPLVLLVWPAMALVRRPTAFWARGLIGLALLAAALAAHSGASVVALAFGAAVCGATLLYPRAVLWSGVVLSFLLVVATPWTGTVVRTLLPPHATGILSGQHAEERIAIWSSFGRHIRDKHLFGHGFLTSFKIAQDVADPTAAVTGADMIIDRIHPHNVILQVWIEFGTLGAILIGAALVFATVRLTKLAAPDRATRLGFLASAASVALVGLNAWAPWWLAVMALCLTLFAIDRMDPASPADQ